MSAELLIISKQMSSCMRWHIHMYRQIVSGTWTSVVVISGTVAKYIDDLSLIQDI